MRQNRLSSPGTHAWRAGERVRAPFFSQCEDALTLTVDPLAPGGLRNYKHSDSFLIENSREHLESLRYWRGHTFEGVLEVIAPVADEGWANAQLYRARVVSLRPPESEFNPSIARVKELKSNQVVFLSGRVIQLTPEQVTIETPKYTYFVDLRAGAPALEGDLGETIRTVSPEDHLEVGDYVQLKAYAHIPNPLSKTRTLRVDQRRSCYLEAPSERRLEAYLDERKLVREMLRGLMTSVRWYDWALARTIDAALEAHRLTPVERSRRALARSKMPAPERGLDAARVRDEVDLFEATFGISLSEITLPGLHDFARSWAEARGPLESRDPSQEQATLFRLLEATGASRDFTAYLARTAARRHLRHFEARADRGHGRRDADWRDMIRLSESLRYLGDDLSTETIDFVMSVVAELARREAAGWSFAGHFVLPAIESLNRQVNFARDDRSLIGARARQVLSRRIAELQHARADLAGAPGAPSAARAQALVTLRFALEIAEAW
jgi:hypothetical protein